MTISPIGSMMSSWASSNGGSGVFSAISSGIAASSSTTKQGPLVNVDPKVYVGTWSGNWGKEGAFTVQVLQVQKYSAQVIYKNGSTVQSSTVLIRDGSIKIGDMKIMMDNGITAQKNSSNPSTGADKASCALVVTDAASGNQTLVQTVATRKS